MDNELHIESISLNYKWEVNNLISFLQLNNLRYEEDIEIAYGVFDTSDTLVACGCAAKNILKCFAVNSDYRGQNLIGSLVSTLTAHLFKLNRYDLFIFTKPENIQLFTNCGFYLLAKTDCVAILENKKDGVQQFLSNLQKYNHFNEISSTRAGIGSIVMNCNPFTLGHRALAEYASKKCDILHIFVVEEDHSLFSTNVRYQLVKDGLADLKNVYVHLSGPYIISGLTFPSYFLKKDSDIVMTQCNLDITLFAELIAPALKISKRFVGEEPFDNVTARYNIAMKSILPKYGLELIEIPRLTYNNKIITASRVRAILQEKGFCEEVCNMVPPTTQKYLSTHWKNIEAK